MRFTRLKHVRYGKFDRVRRRKDLRAFLSSQATRLLSSVSTIALSIDVTAEEFAAGVLTFGANAGNGKVVTIGSKTYTFKTALTEGTASGDLVTDNTNAANNSTVVVGAVTYTFQQTSVTPGTANSVHVLIGANADASLLNLARAINNSGGTPGTDYDTTGTGAHPLVSSSASVTAHTITLTGKAPGVAANVATTASTSPDSHIDPEAATLTGGVDPIVNEVKIGVSASASLDNLIAAVTGDTGEGSTYATGTAAHTLVDAAAGTGDTVDVTALDAGIAGNQIETTTDVVSATWGDAHLTGGVDEAFGPQISSTAHGQDTGDGPFVMAGTARPTGVAATDLFWVFKVGANDIKLSRSLEALQRGVYESFEDAGDTVVLKRPASQEGIYELLRRNDAVTIAAAADIDNLR